MQTLMKRMWVISLLVMLLPVIASGQETMVEASVVYEVDGATGARIYKDRVLCDRVPEKLTFTPLGWVKVIPEISNIQYSVEDINRKPIEFTELENGLIEIRATGKVWVRVTAVDFENNIYIHKTVMLDIGDATITPDVPDVPDVPDDIDPAGPFDGLAARVNKYKSKIQIDNRNQLVTVLNKTADQMQSFQFKQQSQALKYLAKNRPSSAGKQGLVDLYKLLSEDSGKRQLSWQGSQDYYREIVKGLR